MMPGLLGVVFGQERMMSNGSRKFVWVAGPLGLLPRAVVVEAER